MGAGASKCELDVAGRCEFAGCVQGLVGLEVEEVEEMASRIAAMAGGLDLEADEVAIVVEGLGVDASAIEALLKTDTVPALAILGPAAICCREGGLGVLFATCFERFFVTSASDACLMTTEVIQGLAKWLDVEAPSLECIEACCQDLGFVESAPRTATDLEQRFFKATDRVRSLKHWLDTVQRASIQRALLQPARLPDLDRDDVRWIGPALSSARHGAEWVRVSRRVYLLFGGLKLGTHLTNDLVSITTTLFLDAVSKPVRHWHSSSESGAPSPRRAHAACRGGKDNRLLVFGGLGHADNVLDDLWVCDLLLCATTTTTTSGGGVEEEKCSTRPDDRPEQISAAMWTRPVSNGPRPAPRQSAALAVLREARTPSDDGLLLIAGGGADARGKWPCSRVFAATFPMDISRLDWVEVSVFNAPSFGRAAFMVPLADETPPAALLVLGGGVCRLSASPPETRGNEEANGHVVAFDPVRSAPWGQPRVAALLADSGRTLLVADDRGLVWNKTCLLGGEKTPPSVAASGIPGPGRVLLDDTRIAVLEDAPCSTEPGGCCDRLRLVAPPGIHGGNATHAQMPTADETSPDGRRGLFPVAPGFFARPLAEPDDTPLIWARPRAVHGVDAAVLLPSTGQIAATAGSLGVIATRTEISERYASEPPTSASSEWELDLNSGERFERPLFSDETPLHDEYVVTHTRPSWDQRLVFDAHRSARIAATGVVAARCTGRHSGGGRHSPCEALVSGDDHGRLALWTPSGQVLARAASLLEREDATAGVVALAVDDAGKALFVATRGRRHACVAFYDVSLGAFREHARCVLDDPRLVSQVGASAAYVGPGVAVLVAEPAALSLRRDKSRIHALAIFGGAPTHVCAVRRKEHLFAGLVEDRRVVRLWRDRRPIAHFSPHDGLHVEALASGSKAGRIATASVVDVRIWTVRGNGDNVACRVATLPLASTTPEIRLLAPSENAVAAVDSSGGLWILPYSQQQQQQQGTAEYIPGAGAAWTADVSTLEPELVIHGRHFWSYSSPRTPARSLLGENFTTPTDSAAVRAVVSAYSPTGKRVAVAYTNGAVRVTRRRPLEQGVVVRPRGSFVSALAWAPDGLGLAVGCLDGDLEVYLDEDGWMLTYRALSAACSTPCLALDWTLDSAFVRVAGSDGSLRLWRLPENQPDDDDDDDAPEKNASEPMPLIAVQEDDDEAPTDWASTSADQRAALRHLASRLERRAPLPTDDRGRRSEAFRLCPSTNPALLVATPSALSPIIHATPRGGPPVVLARTTPEDPPRLLTLAHDDHFLVEWDVWRSAAAAGNDDDTV